MHSSSLQKNLKPKPEKKYGVLHAGFKKLNAADMRRIFLQLTGELRQRRPRRCGRYEGVASILAKLPLPHPVWNLNFVGNEGLGDEGMRHLDLVPPTVTDFDLSDCGLTCVGIERLCEFMKTNQSITRLTMWGNYMNDEAVKHIAAMLEVNTTLQHQLDFSERNENVIESVTSKGWTYISNALKVNCTLRGLSLGSNLRFRDYHLLALGPGLKDNVGLKELDLWRTCLTDLAFRRYIPLILKHNKTLMKISHPTLCRATVDQCSKETLEELDFYLNLNQLVRGYSTTTNQAWVEALVSSAKFSDPGFSFEVLRAKPELCAF